MSFPLVSTIPTQKVIPIVTPTINTTKYTPNHQIDDYMKTTIQKDEKTNNYYIITDTINTEEDLIMDVNGNFVENTIIQEDTTVQNINSSLVDPYDSLKKNNIMQFYIGSLTIVGLFILFRMIQKTR
jgi:hypothetical protein